VSTVISAFNSLTLSPALTALLLRPRDKQAAPPLPKVTFPLVGGVLGWIFLAPLVDLDPRIAAGIGVVAGFAVGGWLNRVLGTLFRAFNRGFDRATSVYSRMVGGLLRVSILVLIVYGGLVGLTWWSL